MHLKNIYFRYEKHSPDVLNNLELKANFGEILTVLGGNGSGKTTLLSVVGNVNKPYSGKVINHGRKTAVLPQNVKSVFTKDVLREDFALITKDFEEVCKKYTEEFCAKILLGQEPISKLDEFQRILREDLGVNALLEMYTTAYDRVK